jgi:hypothetical protein
MSENAAATWSWRFVAFGLALAWVLAPTTIGAAGNDREQRACLVVLDFAPSTSATCGHCGQDVIASNKGTGDAISVTVRRTQGTNEMSDTFALQAGVSRIVGCTKSRGPSDAVGECADTVSYSVASCSESQVGRTVGN